MREKKPGIKNKRLETEYRKRIDFKKRRTFFIDNWKKINFLLTSTYLDLIEGFYEIQPKKKKFSSYLVALKLKLDETTIIKMLDKAYRWARQHI